MLAPLKTSSLVAFLLTLVAAAPGADLVNGLGNVNGTPTGPGFGENVLVTNDDSWAHVDISTVFPGGLRFGGRLYTSLTIANNGGLLFRPPGVSLQTVESYAASFTPSQIQAGASVPRIAAFFADVDTRGTAFGGSTPGGTSTGANRIYYDLDTVNRIVTVTWDDVGYYNSQVDLRNAFQIRLAAVGEGGDFDIEFRYEAINWTTGSASGGSGGVGGTIARAGYTAADGINFYELPQSGLQGTPSITTIDPPGADLATAGGMLDLAQLSNINTPGVFAFSIRRPRVTITPASGTYTNASPIIFTVSYDQNVTGFDAADVTATGGTVGGVTTITPGRVFTVPVTPAADGVVTFTVREDAAASSAGNGNAATSVSVISDRTPPTVVSITPTGNAEINTVDVPFTVTFSEPMINLVAGDFTSTNGGPLSLSGSGATWRVIVRSASDAALELRLPMASCTDRAGNTLVSDGVAQVVVDATGPSVNVEHSVSTGVTNSLAPVTFTFTFSDPVTGFIPSDVSVANGTAAATFASATTTTYTLAITPTADGLVSATVPAGAAIDDVGLGNFAGSKAFRLDRVAPTVAITPTNAVISTDAAFTFIFSEAMTGFDSADLTISNGAVTSGPVLVPGTIATYRATISANGSGNVTVTVNAGSGLTDIAGNPLAAAISAIATHSASLSPLSITTTASEPNTAATIAVTFSFSAAATGFTAGDVAISNGSGGALVDAGFSAGTYNYTMDVTPAGRGLVTISVSANACLVGTAGNESATLVVNNDPSGPLPIFSIAPITGAYPGQWVWLTVTFDEDVTGMTDGDFTVTNGLKAGFNSINARTYQVLVQISPRPNTSGTVSMAAGAGAGANGRDTQAASINLMAPTGASGTIGGSRGCGLGSGLAVLLLLLVTRLQGGQRFALRRR